MNHLIQRNGLSARPLLLAAGAISCAFVLLGLLVPDLIGQIAAVGAVIPLTIGAAALLRAGRDVAVVPTEPARALGLGMLLSAVGLTVSVVMQPALDSQLVMSLGELILTFGAISIAVGLHIFPGAPEDPERQTRLAVDVFFVALVAFSGAWVLHLDPELSRWTWSVSLHVGVTVAAAMALGTGLQVLTTHRHGLQRRAAVAIGTGFIATFIGVIVLMELTGEGHVGWWAPLLSGMPAAGATLLLSLAFPQESVESERITAKGHHEAESRMTTGVVAVAAIIWVASVFTIGIDRVVAMIGCAVFVVGSLGYVLSLRSRQIELVGLSKAADDRGRQLEGQAARFEAMIANSSDYVLLMDPQGRVRYQSSSVRRMLGHVPSVEVIEDLLHADDRQVLTSLLTRARASTPDPVVARLRFLHSDGTHRVLESMATDLTEDPNVDGVILNSRDVTERRDLERRLSWRATHDTLTTLANRDLLIARVRRALVSSNERPGPRPSVLFIDLDGFKTVNDTLGHSAGDDLLRLVAERLRHSTRGADLVARLGGDEFGVLLTGSTARSAQPVAVRILDALREPFDLQGSEVRVNGSIGIAEAKEGVSVDDLLVQADLAMYAAKGAGGNRHMHFDPAMNADAAERLDLHTRLRDAITIGKIEVLYQPVIEASTGRIVSAEALSRWDDPHVGKVSPLRFIPLAEDTGLIVRLGRHVLDQAIETIALWHDLNPETAGTIAVNVSARELNEPSFSAWISATLQRHSVSPELLTLEITERLLVEPSGPVIENLETLRRAGISIAIDDFGTGYSSLSMLDHLPADVLKIDRAFIVGLTPDTARHSLAGVIVQLARTLGMKTVAEGVETADQHASLQLLGCTHLQGFRFGHPDSAAALVERTAVPAIRTAS